MKVLVHAYILQSHFLTKPKTVFSNIQNKSGPYTFFIQAVSVQSTRKWKVIQFVIIMLTSE